MPKLRSKNLVVVRLSTAYSAPSLSVLEPPGFEICSMTSCSPLTSNSSISLKERPSAVDMSMASLKDHLYLNPWSASMVPGCATLKWANPEKRASVRHDMCVRERRARGESWPLGELAALDGVHLFVKPPAP